jgi:hypothetical protein
MMTIAAPAQVMPDATLVLILASEIIVDLELAKLAVQDVL